MELDTVQDGRMGGNVDIDSLLGHGCCLLLRSIAGRDYMEGLRSYDIG